MSYADFVKSDNVREQRTKLLSVVTA
jgi:hypothetical protein